MNMNVQVVTRSKSPEKDNFENNNSILQCLKMSPE